MAASSRPDLAALVVPLGRVLTAAERPILDRYGLTMWAYIVLLRLDQVPLRTQAALSAAIGADKTRIIDVLTDLQERGLIRREPDPADRRARLIALTTKGRLLRDRAQRAIQRNEDRVLATLSADERRVLLQALQRLAALPAKEFGAG